MAVDFKTLNKIVAHVINSKNPFPVMLRGRHGIGKSQCVYQIAATLGKKVVERRASTMTEGDLLGLPSIDGNSTKWNPPDWYKMACDEGVVLFLDEIDRATQEVRQGIFELTDSRKLSGWHLHPGTLVFAAVNGGTHGAQYQVGEMDPAELDRWTVFDLEPTPEDWLDFAKDKVDGSMWDFINQNRTHLEHKGEYEPNKVYPSRRSWFRLNECLQGANMYTNIQDNLSMLYELTCAFVGFEAAVAFRDFAEKIDRQVTVEDILDSGKLDKVKAWTINDHTAMIDKMIASGRLKTELDPKLIKNLADYAKAVPAEAFMKLWKGLAQENTKNTVKLHPIVKDRLVKVLAPDQKK